MSEGAAAPGLQSDRAALEAQLAKKLEAIKREGERAAAELEKQHESQLQLLARRTCETTALSNDLQELGATIESTTAEHGTQLDRVRRLKTELAEAQTTERCMRSGLREMQKERDQMSSRLDVLRGVAVELSSDDEDETPPPTNYLTRTLRATSSHVQGQVAKRARSS